MAEVSLPIAGPSNPSQADMQRSINLFSRRAQAEGEKAPKHLVDAPGTALFCTLSYTRQRGWHVMDGRVFIVAGSRVLEVRSDATIYEWGSISTVWGEVTMASINGKLVIGDGSGFYLLDPTLGTVEIIADAPRGRECISFNQRIVYNEAETGRNYYSELNDPTNIPGANYFTAENRPDALNKLVALEDKICGLGVDSTEFFYDTGVANQPLQRIQGSVRFNGCEAPDTVVRADNAIFYVGKTDEGGGQVFRINGFDHIITSTHAVEDFLKTATNLSAFAYQEDGDTFYQINADQGSWALNIGEGEWSERGWLNPATGKLERARQKYHAYAYGKHLVGDYKLGKIYEQSTAYYSDADAPLLRKRVFRGPHADNRQIVVDELHIDMECGVGIESGQGSNPKAMLRFSTDGGDAWSNEMTTEIGKVGERFAHCRFHRLGAGREWAYELAFSDPVPITIRGATARYRQGRR